MLDKDNKIIDDVKKLLELNDDELNEKLLEPKYNKANLRELLRRTLSYTQELESTYKDTRHSLKDEIDDYQKRVFAIRELTDDVDE